MHSRFYCLPYRHINIPNDTCTALPGNKLDHTFVADESEYSVYSKVGGMLQHELLEALISH